MAVLILKKFKASSSPNIQFVMVTLSEITLRKTAAATGIFSLRL